MRRTRYKEPPTTPLDELQMIAQRLSDELGVAVYPYGLDPNPVNIPVKIIPDNKQDEWYPRPGEKVSWVNGRPVRPVDDPALDERVALKRYYERQRAMDDPEVLREISRLKGG